MHSTESIGSPTSSVILCKETSIPIDTLAKHHIFGDSVELTIHDENERYQQFQMQKGVVGADVLMNNSVEISERSLQIIKRIPLGIYSINVDVFIRSFRQS